MFYNYGITKRDKMNRSLIIFSIAVVSILAYADARDRLKELDEVAANTPAQVEMKPMFNNNLPNQEFDNKNDAQHRKPDSSPNQFEKINKYNKQNEQSLKDFQKRRNDDLFK